MDKQEQPKPRVTKMDWMEPDELKELEHVAAIRSHIITKGGLLDPADNIKALNFMAHYYARNTERLGKYEAMQRELFADLLERNDGMAIGKAEAVSKGSEFGKCRVFYEQLCAGYLEMINAFKKTQDYWEEHAKNNM